MQIFVISLTSSQDRRAKVLEKLGSQHIEFEFLDAVDGRINDHPYLKNYNEQAFLTNRRRKAAAGELGCYVSHLLAWEKCLALNEAIVVLEDDFELKDNFAKGLKFVEPFINQVSFIRLEPLESTLFVTSHKGTTFSLVKQLKVAMCATGYIVTPKGARIFLEKGIRIRYPIDFFLKQTCIHKQAMYAIVPALIYPTHADSIIGIDIRNRREKGIILKIKRFFRKWTYAMGNIIVNITNIYKNI
jgi:glycosyl transferase family 25